MTNHAATNVSSFASLNAAQAAPSILDEIVISDAMLAYVPDHPIGDGPGMKAGIQDVLKDNVFTKKIASVAQAKDDHKEEVQEEMVSRLTYVMLLQYQQLKQKVGDGNIVGASKIDEAEAGYLELDELEGITLDMAYDIDEKELPHPIEEIPRVNVIDEAPMIEPVIEEPVGDISTLITELAIDYVLSGGAADLA